VLANSYGFVSSHMLVFVAGNRQVGACLRGLLHIV